MREFETGATRDTDEGKLDYEGFLSPLALESYAAYMHENRVQADGELRDSDNWQKGIPRDAYMKSMFRHFIDVWRNHRGWQTATGMEKSLNALLFNVMGYLHEWQVGRNAGAAPETCAPVTDEMVEEARRDCCGGSCGESYRAPFTGTPIVDDDASEWEQPCTCTTACIPQGMVEGQTCRMSDVAPGGALLERARLTGRHEGAMSVVEPTGAIDRNGDA